MPFCCKRQSRLKIIACLFGAAQLLGCATTEQSTAPAVDEDQAAAELAELFAESPAEPATPEAAQAKPVTEPVQAPSKDVIEKAVDESSMEPLDQIAANAPKVVLPTPQTAANIQIFEWRVIDGAPIGNVLTGVTKTRFIRPVAIAVQSEYLYVVDEGNNVLYRYDLVSERMEAVLDLKAEVKGEVADIYVSQDFSFYLTDTEAGRVLHYDRNGRLLQEFRNYFNLVWPVAVTVLEGGDVIVADGRYDHLLHFDSKGELIATYGGRGEAVAEFLNITTMAKGPDGYYVGSRVGRRLQVIGWDGNYLYAFEEGSVVFPASIVVDRNNHSYIADYMDNTIKVFDRGTQIGTIGGFGVNPGEFKRITDLWLDGNRLYIVDSLNGRIQAAKLAPDPMPLPAPDAELFQEAAPESADSSVEPSPEEMADELTKGAAKEPQEDEAVKSGQ